jgi:hypothetical protein
VSGWPWWAQAYTMLAVLHLGYFLGAGEHIGGFCRLVGATAADLLLAALWPVFWVLVGGMALADREKR